MTRTPFVSGTRSTQSLRVGVVGAGITGLAVTHYLRRAGISVRTFETMERCGGVIRSERKDGRLLEYGPQRLRRTPIIDELIADFGLGRRLRTADPRLPVFVYGDERLRPVPRSIGAFLRTDALSLGAKIRVLLEPFVPAGPPDEMAGELLVRKFGEETYRNLIEPLLAGVYASDPMEMPASFALAPLLRLEAREGSLLRVAMQRVRGTGVPAAISFDDGVETLPRALAEAHADAIEMGTTVTGIVSTGHQDGYSIETTDGTYDVDVVVVTTPAETAAELLAPVENARAAPLRSLRFNPLAIVHLHAETSANGFGYQVRRDAGFASLGVTWNASLFERDGVYTVFLGGAWDPSILDRSPTHLGWIARHEFESVMGTDADVLDVEVYPGLIPAYDTSWMALREVSLPEDIVLATNYTGRIGVGGRVRAGQEVAMNLARAVSDA